MVKGTSFIDQHTNFENGYWPMTQQAMLPQLTHLTPPQPSSQNIKMIIQSTIDNNSASTIQTDSGANICATGNKTHLHDYTPITPRTITGVNKDDDKCAKIHGYGFLYLHSIDNTTTKVKVYYSPSVEDTIISPQAISSDNKHDVNGWYQYANTDNDSGILGFSLRNGAKLEFTLYCHNNLWYHSIDEKKPINYKGSVANVLSDSQNYQLWHSRLGHPGINTMKSIHHHSTGVPKLKGNAFWRCPSCMPMKLAIKKPLYESAKRKPVKPSELTLNTEPTNNPATTDDLFMHSAQPGQHFHVDFGFFQRKEIPNH